MSYQEISDITGLKLGTVKSRLARARMELKNKLNSANP
jgi:DNA-directed RNA polymerase specialized sigma24 family protein